MTADHDFRASFNAVVPPSRPAPTPAAAGLIAASHNVVEFINVCDAAIWIALPTGADPLAGADVECPVAMLNAYLLFLANECLATNSRDINDELVKNWHVRVTPDVWELLGFAWEPDLLSVQDVFALLGQPGNLPLEMVVLVWAVGAFASSELMPGLRR